MSYTWGELGGARETIEVDGRHLPVQRNLFDFLRQLQVYNESWLLWIDAVCIDQGRLQERNHQVQLMNEIYRYAREVLVWLGPVTSSSDEATKVLLARPEIHSKGSVFEPENL